MAPDRPTDSLPTTQPRWALWCGGFLGAILISVGALLWPTETTLNLVGGVLIALQLAALAIVLNPRARGRLAWGAFLLASGVHTYWWYWIRSDAEFSLSASERFWASPVGESWALLLRWLTNDWDWQTRPTGPFAYLRNWDVYHFTSVGLLLTSLVVGAAVAWATAAVTRRFATASSAANRHSFQLSIRTLLLYTLLISLGLAWAVRERRLSENVRVAFDQLESKDLTFGYTSRPNLFPWFNKLVWLDTPGQIHGVLFDEQAEEKDFVALANLRSLEEVKIWSRDDIPIEVNDAMLAHLRHVPGLRSVSIEHSAVSEGCGFSAAGLMHLEGLPLERLELIAVEGFDDTAFLRITQFERLKSLKLSSEDVTSSALTHLGTFRDLERLELSGMPVTNDTARVIGSLRRLKHVHVPDSQIDDDGLAHLANLTQLESLELPDTITDRGLVHLHKITTLKSLRANGDVTDASMPWIGGNKNLESLRLRDAPITDNGVEHLQSLRNLYSLSLPSGDFSDRTLRMLAQHKKLGYLSVGGDRITDAGFRQLAALPELQHLAIGGPGITNVSMDVIDEFRRLSQVHIGRRSAVDPEAACQAMARAKSRGKMLIIYPFASYARPSDK